MEKPKMILGLLRMIIGIISSFFFFLGMIYWVPAAYDTG